MIRKEMLLGVNRNFYNLSQYWARKTPPRRYLRRENDSTKVKISTSGRYRGIPWPIRSFLTLFQTFWDSVLSIPSVWCKYFHGIWGICRSKRWKNWKKLKNWKKKLSQKFFKKFFAQKRLQVCFFNSYIW